MPVPAAFIPLAITAVKALIRYRSRVDTILSLNEVKTGLPFRLPPAPVDRLAHLDAMIAFGKTDGGRIAYELQGLAQAYRDVASAHAAGERIPRKAALDCVALYFEAADVRPGAFGPAEDAELRERASSGPSEEMRLAYYVVESHRLSRNPALTRVLLATADTLLEVAGESAGLFVSNPRTCALVENLLTGFAVDHDFDDDSTERIFRRLLGAAAVVAIDERGQLSDAPALEALFGALADVRKDLGGNFVEGFISRPGFEKLVAAYATQVVADPAFLAKQPLARDAVSAMLRAFEKGFPRIMERDPDAVFAVLRAGVAVAAAHAPEILDQKLAGQPIPAALLSAFVLEVKKQAQASALFEGIASGEILGALYRAALAGVAVNPEGLATAAGLDAVVRELVAGAAKTLSTTPLRESFSGETFHALLAGSFEALAAHPELVARDHAFGAKVAGAVFAAAAPLVRDGLQKDDVLGVVDAALSAASANRGLLELGDRLEAVLGGFGAALAQKGVQSLLDRESRREALLMSVGAVAANPRVWKHLDEAALAQPLVRKLLEGLATDPTRLVSGPVLVEAFRRSVMAAARRGGALVAKKVDSDALRLLLELSLEAADAEIGKRIDGENLPVFLGRMVQGFLAAPVALDGSQKAALAAFIETTLVEVEAV